MVQLFGLPTSWPFDTDSLSDSELILCDVKLRSPIKLDFFLNISRGNVIIKSNPLSLDFADRRVNLRSAMHNYNDNITVKRFKTNFKPKMNF
jgi:hypothetical protein